MDRLKAHKYNFSITLSALEKEEDLKKAELEAIERQKRKEELAEKVSQLPLQFRVNKFLCTKLN